MRYVVIEWFGYVCVLADSVGVLFVFYCVWFECLLVLLLCWVYLLLDFACWIVFQWWCFCWLGLDLCFWLFWFVWMLIIVVFCLVLVWIMWRLFCLFVWNLFGFVFNSVVCLYTFFWLFKNAYCSGVWYWSIASVLFLLFGVGCALLVCGLLWFRLVTVLSLFGVIVFRLWFVIVLVYT